MIAKYSIAFQNTKPDFGKTYEKKKNPHENPCKSFAQGIYTKDGANDGWISTKVCSFTFKNVVIFWA